MDSENGMWGDKDRATEVESGGKGGPSTNKFRISYLIWRNSDGQNKTILQHLLRHHQKAWTNTVVLKKLKGWEEVVRKADPDTRSKIPKEKLPFTIEGFREHLERWVAVDDQSIAVVECPEFWDLLWYTGTELEESDIPHRTKLSELIDKRFKSEYNKVIDEIRNSLGRLAITGDIWSRINLEGYLAITISYLHRKPSGTIEMRTQLVAFCHVTASHTGANIAKIVMDILTDLGVLNKVPKQMVTLDNASNNNTMMTSVAEELKVLGIPFDVVGNRIQCFPHVVNIAVKTGLKHLTMLLGSATDSDLEGTTDSLHLPDALFEDNDYADALKCNVVSAATSLVTAIQGSGQRREDFKQIIEDGNMAEGWGVVVLPLYEKLILELNAAKEDLPKISHAISASVAKLEEYLQYARQNRVYVLAMVLHPGIKLDWLMKHWSTADFVNAKSVVRTALGSFPEDQESNSDHEQREQEEDKAAVDEELDKYIGSGVFDENDAHWNDLDLIRYWQIAQDVLPAQASAVPCERVFSSSKETDALRRNSLSPLKMEVFQILKYIFGNDRLNFTEDLICTKVELLVADISTETIDYLMANGRGHELASMIDSSFESQRTSG
ncbi:hypothetical protein HHX47_DHR1000060 [Lentinula edodes]|nr:hypothetical protein HHX47_DHR1000060 [Lentinula edodes]